jgi:hypothetical protein
MERRERMAQQSFARYELKYLITAEQRDRILAEIEPQMIPDKYGKSTVRNLYFDTPTYRLIRRSMEKPTYKEKLRLRSYTRASEDSPVFAEIKKKYKKRVYKRRVSVKEGEAMAWFSGESKPSVQGQVVREIDYFLSFYGEMRPSLYLAYDREAYYSRTDDSFRITFDDRILFRQEELTLDSEPYGTSILEEGKVLMEIKCGGGVPLWMTEILSRERIFRTSFSKYGTAYANYIFPSCRKEINDGSIISGTF